MKHIATAVFLSMSHFLSANAQADNDPYGQQTNPHSQQADPYNNYCYSWDCASSNNSITRKGISSGSDDDNKYGDKAKKNKYDDVMKASKLKAPSTCYKDNDDDKDMDAKKDEDNKTKLKKLKNHNLPCVKLY